MNAVCDEARNREAESAGFARLSALAEQEAGLVVDATKITMVRSRLRHRIKDLNCKSFEEYCDFVCSPQGKSERQHLISALTTNVSGFFREAHHFEMLRSRILPEFAKRLGAGQRVRIWSAGCAMGQEAISIAILALEIDPVFASADFKILATDVDQSAISFCETGLFDVQSLAGLSERRKAEFFVQTQANSFEIHQKIRNMISFKVLNLVDDWPMRGAFDVVFCRNVVIYFGPGTQNALWPRFHNLLTDDGWLFLGHSERISETYDHIFSLEGPTAYRKAHLADRGGRNGRSGNAS